MDVLLLGEAERGGRSSELPKKEFHKNLSDSPKKEQRSPLFSFFLSLKALPRARNRTKQSDSFLSVYVALTYIPVVCVLIGVTRIKVTDRVSVGRCVVSETAGSSSWGLPVKAGM